jgi:anti-sigma factor RsiW
MSRFHVPSWSKENWHPSDDELFCYVDGELKPGESQRIKTHLEACWACRVKGEKVQANIVSFVSLLDRAVAQDDDLHTPPRGWRTFEAKVSKVMAESGKPRLFYRWAASIRGSFFVSYLPFRLVGGLALLLTVVTLFLRLHQTTPVSASEILHKAVQAEVQKRQTSMQPVVYQKLQVRRKANPPLREEVATWEIWNDSSSGRFTQRAASANGQQFSHVPLEGLVFEGTASGNRHSEKAGLTADLSPILVELGQIFRTNRLDGRKPLSPSNYETWRKTVDREDERVEERDLSNGRKGLVLSTNAAGPFAPNSIIQADLVVRVGDWHPVAEILRVQGHHEVRDYELTETEFDLLALNSLSPGIFPDIAPPAIRPIPQDTKAPQAVAPTATERIAAEIMVRYALHRVKACLGEPIQIVATDGGSLEVFGLAETPERKEELIAALEAIPLVIVKIQTLAEAQATVSPGGGPVDLSAQPGGNASEGISVVTVRAGKLPIQDELQHYFARQKHPALPMTESENDAGDIHQKIAAFSSRAISLADMALADAFALRRLAEKYPTAKTRSLEPSSRWLLEAMVREHLQSVQTTTVRLRLLLEPVLHSLESGAREDATSKGVVGISSASDWASGVQQLFGTIKRMERLTAFLFAGASLPDEQDGRAAAKLLAAVNQIEQESRGLADQANHPERSDSTALAQER